MLLPDGVSVERVAPMLSHLAKELAGAFCLEEEPDWE